jgi:hypothetical protein
MEVSSFIIGFVDHSFLGDEKQARKKISGRHTRLQIAQHQSPRVDFLHYALHLQLQHSQYYNMAILDSVVYDALSHATKYDSNAKV